MHICAERAGGGVVGCSLLRIRRNRSCATVRSKRTHCVRAYGSQVGGVDLSDVRVALKEWAVTVAALGDGLQTILVRKGGIREPKFFPKAGKFFLFPTGFHANPKMVHPYIAEQYAKEFEFDPKKMDVIRLGNIARVTQAWTTHDKSCLDALRGFHIWTDDYVQSRLQWHEDRAITVMEVRCYAINPPLDLPVDSTFFGCFSWVDVLIPSMSALERTVAPSIDEESFHLRQKELRARLQDVEVEVIM